MEDKGAWLQRAATNSVPNPADFPLGSPQSRAAARALLEARMRVSMAAGDCFLLILMEAGCESPDHEACIQAIHQDCKPGFQMVTAGVIPDYVIAKTEKFLLEHGWRKRSADGSLPPAPADDSGTTKSPNSDVFSRMSPEELDEYAKSGALPLAIIPSPQRGEVIYASHIPRRH
jgi:hypothetical protein